MVCLFLSILSIILFEHRLRVPVAKAAKKEQPPIGDCFDIWVLPRG
jgi:hypothetical protein